MDEHPDRPGHSPPPTKPLRTNLGWLVVCIVAIGAALLVAVLFGADSTGTRTNPYTGIAPVDNRTTQLDVQGIPTWWSHEAGAPQHNDATELDEQGIPTWWST